MSLKDYVIGGMDPSFKLKLHRALRTMDNAGLMPGITSAFATTTAIYRKRQQGCERQLISWRKPPRRLRPRSCGRSRKRQRGHRFQRYASSQELWKWIDAHEKELGIGRPYLDRDPPHVAPLDGADYAAKRGRAIAQKGELQSQERNAWLKDIEPAFAAGEETAVEESAIRRHCP